MSKWIAVHTDGGVSYEEVNDGDPLPSNHIPGSEVIDTDGGKSLNNPTGG